MPCSINTKLALDLKLSASLSVAATATFGADYGANVSIGTEYRREWGEWRRIQGFDSQLNLHPLQTSLQGSGNAEVFSFSLTIR